MNQEDIDAKYTKILQSELPPGIDPKMVNEHNIGELQEQLASLDQWENDLTKAGNWAIQRILAADEQIALADIKFEEIQRHVAAEKAEAKRLKLKAVSDEKIASKNLRRINSAKIALMAILRSMGANR